LRTYPKSEPGSEVSPAAPLQDELREVPAWHRYVQKLTADGHAVGDPTHETQILETARRRPTPGRGRFENNLSRKGIFHLQPDRAPGTRVGSSDFSDLVGKTSLTVPLGALGASEMDLIAWVMGRWERGSDVVQFTLREASRAFGLSWNGQVGTRFKERLRRIMATTITGRVWDAKERKHTTTHFSVFDIVHIEERRDQLNRPASTPATVTIKFSDWLLSQLKAGQYSDFDWTTYRSKLTTPFTRRLYLLLESHNGEEEGTVVRFPISRALGNTLGTSDAVSNPTRFRRRLREAGDEITKAGIQYVDVSVRTGPMRWEYSLEVRRSRSWLQARIRSRRRAVDERRDW
jgi:hypothetical protein